MKWESVDISAVPEAVSGQLLVLILVGLFVLQLVWRRGRRGWKGRRNTWRGPRSTHSMSNVVPFQQSDITDPKAQMHAISLVNFEKQRLLNKTEYRVLRVLERVVSEAGNGHRIMAQTSLGELIRPKAGHGTNDARKQAYASINSKRLDFAIIDKFGILAVAIEVQGSGHYHQTTFMRDAVKREALRRAGVDLIEVQETWSPEDITNRVRRDLQASTSKKVAPQPQRPATGKT